jgi:hypothetical protein
VTTRFTHRNHSLKAAQAPLETGTEARLLQARREFVAWLIDLLKNAVLGGHLPRTFVARGLAPTLVRVRADAITVAASYVGGVPFTTFAFLTRIASRAFRRPALDSQPHVSTAARCPYVRSGSWPCQNALLQTLGRGEVAMRAAFESPD